MAYTKPQVTIDLEEYQNLQEQISELESENDKKAGMLNFLDKFLIFSLSNKKETIENLKEYAAKMGRKVITPQEGEQFPFVDIV